MEKLKTPITALSHDGRGIAHINGKITFIENALPGETVSFTYTKRHNKYDEGRAVEIVTASADRAEPLCRHYGVCGGCSLQHMSSAAQLVLKQKMLLEQLQHFGGVQPETILPPLTGLLWGYRRKARLGVKYVAKKGGVLVGFREKNNRFLADLQSCEVLHVSIGHLIAELKTLISNLQAYKDIPQIEVAVDDDQSALIFRHMAPLETADQDKLIAFAKIHSLRLYLQPGGPQTVHLIWPENVSDKLSYRLPDYDLALTFQPTGFTQINTEINRQMVKQAIELLALKSTDRVLDLFCGIGNFTLPLARNCGEVIGVEGDADLVKQAQQNAEVNRIANAYFYQADLTADFAGAAWAKNSFHKIMLDPPRAGALEIAQNITRFKAERILYVSCNPATLARDAGELAQRGYRLVQAGIMDMFPHTQHVEAMALFVKK
jgi:23S rRNA (uracil1939-C5)-methyltransferase